MEATFFQSRARTRKHELAVTVYALRDRGLVNTRRSGGTWEAEITEAGRRYLSHEYYPGDLASKVPSPETKTPDTNADEAVPARTPSVTAEDLMRELRAGQGFLRRYLGRDAAELGDWRGAADEARSRAMAPEGFHLRSRIQRTELVLELLVGPGPEAFKQDAEPVARCHPPPAGPHPPGGQGSSGPPPPRRFGADENSGRASPRCPRPGR